MPRLREAAKVQMRRLRFAVRIPEADEVVLTGDFVNWDPEGILLHHSDRDEWYATLELPAGEYQYRLRVDGEWRDDPKALHRVPNPFGTQNCVLMIE